MEAPVIRPRAGIRLDYAKFDHELARRGISAADLAAASGVHQVVLSRARHGASIREATFRRIVAALLTIPPLDGAVELLQEPVS
jgi:transcriptional regulator with XRE-family HTH domain